VSSFLALTKVLVAERLIRFRRKTTGFAGFWSKNSPPSIFSIVNSTLLKPMGYENPGRLVVIWTTPAQNPEQTGTWHHFRIKKVNENGCHRCLTQNYRPSATG